MNGSIVLLCVCGFLSVYGHVEAMYLADLVIQTAAKLNAGLLPSTNLQDTDKNSKIILDMESTHTQVANKQHVKQGLEPIAPSEAPNTLHKNLQTDAVSVKNADKKSSGNQRTETNHATAMQWQQQNMLNSPPNGAQQTDPIQSEASIKEAAELVLQYIKLTPNFAGLHNMPMPGDTGQNQLTTNHAQAPVIQASKKASSGLKVSALLDIDQGSVNPHQKRGPIDGIQQIRTPGSNPQVSIHEAVKLLMKVAPNMTEQSFPQTQVVNTDSTCRGPCPPKWIKIVNFFSHLLSPGSEMCHIHQVMQLERCELPNTSCKPGYTCCSSSCLPEIVVCDPWYPHSVPDHICLPEDVSGWWPDVQEKFLHIASHAAKHGHQTVNTTRTLP